MTSPHFLSLAYTWNLFFYVQSIKNLKYLVFEDGGVASVINNVYLCTRYCAYCAGLKPSIH